MAYTPRIQTLAALRNTGNTLSDMAAVTAAERERISRNLLSGKEHELRLEQVRGQNEERLLGAKSILARNEQENLQTQVAIEKAHADAIRQNRLDTIAQEKEEREKALDTMGRARDLYKNALIGSGMKDTDAEKEIASYETNPEMKQYFQLMTTPRHIQQFATDVIRSLRAKNAEKIKEHDDYNEMDKLAARLEGVPETDPSIAQTKAYMEKKGYVLTPYHITKVMDTGTLDQYGNPIKKPIQVTKYTAMRKETFDQLNAEYEATRQSAATRVFARENKRNPIKGDRIYNQESKTDYFFDGQQWNEIEPIGK